MAEIYNFMPEKSSYIINQIPFYSRCCECNNIFESMSGIRIYKKVFEENEIRKGGLCKICLDKDLLILKDENSLIYDD